MSPFPPLLFTGSLSLPPSLPPSLSLPISLSSYVTKL